MTPANLPPVRRLQVWGPHIIEKEVGFTDVRSTLVGLSVWLYYLDRCVVSQISYNIPDRSPGGC